MVKNLQIAGRVLKLMSDKNISAYKLCKDLNIHSGLFSSMKDGKTRWQLEILIEIAEYLNVTLDQIVFGGNNILGSKDKAGIYGKISTKEINELKEENLKLKTKLKVYEKIKKEFGNI